MDDVIKLIVLIGFKNHYETESICQYYIEYNGWEYRINIKKTIIKTKNKIEIIRIIDNVKIYTEYHSDIMGINECLGDLKILFRYVLRKKKLEQLFNEPVEKNA